MNKRHGSFLILACLLAASASAWAQTSQPPLAKPLGDFDKLISELRPSSVVGEPIRVGETTIVPFAKISFGLGGGGAMMGYGGGMGAKTSALGILIVEGDDVRAEVFPEEPPAPSPIEKLLRAILEKKIVFIGNGVNAPSAESLEGMQPALKDMLGGVNIVGNVLNLPAMSGKPKGASTPGPAAPAPPAKAKSAAPGQAQGASLPAMIKLFDEKKYPEALAMVDDLIAKDPKSSDLQVWKGRIMGAMTQSGDMMDLMKYGAGAMQAFEEAVRLDPKNPDALFGRGVSRIMAPQGFGGDVDGAIADLEAAIAIKPSPEEYFYLGEAFRTKGLNDKAAEAYSQALKLRPGYTEAAKALASVKG